MFEYRATVLRVVDGDTVDVEIDLGLDIRHRTRLRLYGINAPEVRGPSRESGKASADALRGLIADSPDVIVQTVKDRREKYGRYLATIWAGETNVNEAMVTMGFAEASPW